MAKIDSAYAYYASTYANKEVSRYDSHKKSDLRKIYNRIIKTNKESPSVQDFQYVRSQEICYRYKGKL